MFLGLCKKVKTILEFGLILSLIGLGCSANILTAIFFLTVFSILGLVSRLIDNT